MGSSVSFFSLYVISKFNVIWFDESFEIFKFHQLWPSKTAIPPTLCRSYEKKKKKPKTTAVDGCGIRRQMPRFMGKTIGRYLVIIVDAIVLKSFTRCNIIIVVADRETKNALLHTRGRILNGVRKVSVRSNRRSSLET